VSYDISCLKFHPNVPVS